MNIKIIVTLIAISILSAFNCNLLRADDWLRDTLTPKKTGISSTYGEPLYYVEIKTGGTHIIDISDIEPRVQHLLYWDTTYNVDVRLFPMQIINSGQPVYLGYYKKDFLGDKDSIIWIGNGKGKKCDTIPMTIKRGSGGRYTATHPNEISVHFDQVINLEVKVGELIGDDDVWRSISKENNTFETYLIYGSSSAFVSLQKKINEDDPTPESSIYVSKTNTVEITPQLPEEIWKALGSPVMYRYTFTPENGKGYFGLKIVDSENKSKPVYSTSFVYMDWTDNIADMPLPSFKVFPNPAKDLITIALAIPDVPSVVTISNEAGQEILTQTIVNTQDIDISAFPTGVYFIKVGDAVEKLVVE